jgi:hypothetical protein
VSAFLAELGKKLAERWMTLLVVPGLLYVTTAVAATVLGRAHVWSFGLLPSWIIERSKSAGADRAGTILLVASAVLVASAGAGLGAVALGRCVEAVWSLPGRRWPSRWLRVRRSRRWDAADGRVRTAMEAAVRAPLPVPAAQVDRPVAQALDLRPDSDLAAALRARNRISGFPPAHATWIGDRLGAAGQRIYRTYELDLAAAWPRLWLLVPEAVRTELSSAHDAYSAAARLAGWAVLYLGLAAWWWPASLIAMVAGITAHIRGRAAAAVLSDLTEATVDLYGNALATALGIEQQGQLSRETGRAVTRQLRKDELTLPAAVEPLGLAGRSPGRRGRS